MPKTTTVTTTLNKTDVLNAALVGLQIQKERVEAAILELKGKLEGPAIAPTVKRRGRRAASEAAPSPKRRRTMSEAGKAAVREALRKRWAKYRREQKKLHK